MWSASVTVAVALMLQVLSLLNGPSVIDTDAPLIVPATANVLAPLEPLPVIAPVVQSSVSKLIVPEAPPPPPCHMPRMS